MRRQQHKSSDQCLSFPLWYIKDLVIENIDSNNMRSIVLPIGYVTFRIQENKTMITRWALKEAWEGVTASRTRSHATWYETSNRLWTICMNDKGETKRCFRVFIANPGKHWDHDYLSKKDVQDIQYAQCKQRLPWACKYLWSGKRKCMPRQFWEI